MKRRIEDYLHLHLGCLVIIERANNFLNNPSRKFTSHGPYKLVGVDISDNKTTVKIDNYLVSESDVIRPILRPLSDMTEDEAIEFGWMRLFTLEHFVEKKLFQSELLGHMLVRHFDLFDLIQDGLALDATTMKYDIKDEQEIILPAVDPHPVAGGTPGL